MVGWWACDGRVVKLVAKCEMMRSAKGGKKEGEGEMRLVWKEMKMVVEQVSEVELSIDA